MNAEPEAGVVADVCRLCGEPCPRGESLCNGEVYHLSCYTTLLTDIDGVSGQIAAHEEQLRGIGREIARYSSFISRLRRAFFGSKVDPKELASRELAISQELRELADTRAILLDVRRELYDYWLTYPPDWDSRAAAAGERDGYTCQDCGDFLGFGRTRHTHHNTPISQGGNHRLGDLVTLCEECHSKQHSDRPFSQLTAEHVGAFGRRLPLLRQAMNENRLVSFSYTKFDGARSVRSLRPEGMKRVGRSLCVFGHCYLRNAERVFAIKRMRGVKIADVPGPCHDG
ncbi:MAG: WYL domain-containing protein [Verrucomicrobia bacterium]|nr:WYL domain-containing protein [Verrucomicrobiota bacterium]